VFGLSRPSTKSAAAVEHFVLLLTIFFYLFSNTSSVSQRSSIHTMASLHDFKGKTLGGGTRAAPIEGSEFDFAQLKGKVVLINNVATM
jgi:hypothetical protein